MIVRLDSNTSFLFQVSRPDPKCQLFKSKSVDLVNNPTIFFLLWTDLNQPCANISGPVHWLGEDLPKVTTLSITLDGVCVMVSRGVVVVGWTKGLFWERVFSPMVIGDKWWWNKKSFFAASSQPFITLNVWLQFTLSYNAQVDQTDQSQSIVICTSTKQKWSSNKIIDFQSGSGF